MEVTVKAKSPRRQQCFRYQAVGTCEGGMCRSSPSLYVLRREDLQQVRRGSPGIREKRSKKKELKKTMASILRSLLRQLLKNFLQTYKQKRQDTSTNYPPNNIFVKTKSEKFKPHTRHCLQ